MGSWTLDFLEVTGSLRDTDGFGNKVVVEFWLQYEPTFFGSFVDAPALYWYEKFLVIDHRARQWWVVEANQYERNTRSQTLVVWYEKYWKAYDNIAYNDGDKFAGGPHVRLYDKKREPVKGDQFKDTKTPGKEKAEAVRTYLRNNGGYLKITVVDEPRMNASAPSCFSKERLLLFDVGVVGQDAEMRVKFQQYLSVDSDKPREEWQRLCRPDWLKKRAPPDDYNQVDPPKQYTEKKPEATNVETGNYF